MWYRMAPSPPGVVFNTGPESTSPRAPTGCVPMTFGGVPVAGSAGGCEMFRTHAATVTSTLSPMAKRPEGAVTVMAAVPFCPSLSAVIVTGPPAPTPVTSPLGDTVATAVFPLDHVTTRPESGVPLASSGVAVSCTVPPAATLPELGLTATDATGTSAGPTVMVAEPT